METMKLFVVIITRNTFSLIPNAYLRGECVVTECTSIFLWGFQNFLLCSTINI